jgi:hypothetical protein
LTCGIGAGRAAVQLSHDTVRTIPGVEAFRPMDKGDCPLVQATK